MPVSTATLPPKTACSRRASAGDGFCRKPTTVESPFTHRGTYTPWRDPRAVVSRYATPVTPGDEKSQVPKSKSGATSPQTTSAPFRGSSSLDMFRTMTSKSVVTPPAVQATGANTLPDAAYAGSRFENPPQWQMSRRPRHFTRFST